MKEYPGEIARASNFKYALAEKHCHGDNIAKAPDKSSCHLSELSTAIATWIVRVAESKMRERDRAHATGERQRREGNVASEIAYGVAGILHRATCVVCSREFIVLYLDLLPAPPRLRGDRRRGTRGDGKKKLFDFHGSVKPRAATESPSTRLSVISFARRRTRR